MFTLYTRYTFTMPDGTLTETGIEQVKMFLVSQDMQSKLWKDLNPNYALQRLPYLPSDWQWVWLVQHGEYSGTMPKRIAKYFFKAHGIKTPHSVSEALGHIARQHSSEPITYTFDFANQIDWADGEFGDENSCWWGEYSGSRLMWDRNNGMSIRFYDEYEDGIARAWLMEIDTDLYTVMNGYGLTTVQITKIFSLFMGLTYKQIMLDNSRSSQLWINNKAGYLVGKREVIENIESHDFDMEGEYEYECVHCGRYLEREDIEWGADDEPYCHSCFIDHFNTCEHCGSIRFSEDMTYLEHLEIDVCDWCLSRNYQICDRCQNYHRKHLVTKIGEGWYCEECAIDVNAEADNIE